MGILSLAAYLRTKFNLEIKLVNQRLENTTVEQLAAQAVEFKADIAGFGALTPTGYMLEPLSRLVRAGLPNALIVLGGPHVAASRAEALQATVADAAVAGEGELSLEALIRARFDGDGDFNSIPGLFWRDRTGEVVSNPGVGPVIQNLDDLPFPAYDLIDVSAYWKAFAHTPIRNRRYISLMTSRGCPYKCIYCQHVLGKGHRKHSAERIVDEIELYMRTYGVNTIEILDDLFNFDRKRVLDFCDLVHRRNLKFHFTLPNGVRSDIFTEEIIDAMAAAGMDECCFALESGSPRIQEFMGKRLQIPKFLEAVEWAVKRGVFCQGVNMLGFPTETEAEMRQTIDVCCSTRLHVATFFTVTPYPGTELYEMVKKSSPEKLATIDYRDAEYCNAKINVSAEPDEVLFACQRLAMRKFYGNPARLWRLWRDHPCRWSLPRYGLQTLLRATKR